MKTILISAGLFLFLALFPSCTSTLLTSSWTKQGYTPQKYKKTLVLAIGKNVSGRAAVESAMVNALMKEGINAVSTLDVFPNYSPDVQLEKTALAQKLKENGIDGFLILSLLDVKTEQVYVQGQTYTQPVSTVYHPNGYYNRYYPSYNNYYNYYSTVYETVTEPGYYEDQTTYYLESNFYHVNDESLVWSAQCEAIDPTNISSGAKDWAEQVATGMMTDKVFVP